MRKQTFTQQWKINLIIVLSMLKCQNYFCYIAFYMIILLCWFQNIKEKNSHAKYEHNGMVLVMLFGWSHLWKKKFVELWNYEGTNAFRNRISTKTSIFRLSNNHLPNVLPRSKMLRFRNNCVTWKVHTSSIQPILNLFTKKRPKVQISTDWFDCVITWSLINAMELICLYYL